LRDMGLSWFDELGHDEDSGSKWESRVKTCMNRGRHEVGVDVKLSDSDRQQRNATEIEGLKVCWIATGQKMKN
jgi:hypothetical protein